MVCIRNITVLLGTVHIITTQTPKAHKTQSWLYYFSCIDLLQLGMHFLWLDSLQAFIFFSCCLCLHEVLNKITHNFPSKNVTTPVELILFSLHSYEPETEKKIKSMLHWIPNIPLAVVRLVLLAWNFLARLTVSVLVPSHFPDKTPPISIL